jgi:hypothetical protein
VSVRASTAVWDYSEAPNNTVLVVALVLADHADYDGQVWISIANVARQARVSRATVYAAITTLEVLKEVVRVHSGGKGRGDITIYRLTLVDKLRKRVQQPDPKKGPKRVQKGSSCLDLKRRDVITYKADAREKRDFVVDWNDPDITEPGVERDAHIADLRTVHRHGKRGEPTA